jgi:integrase
MAGHISRRKRGSATVWRARYPDPTRGATAQIERVFPTRREAERWLNEQRVAVQRGIHVDPADTERRFKDVAAAWRATWLELEPKTKAGYESILSKHVLPRWGEAKIGAVSADATQRWVNELAANGRAPNTVRRIYSVLRSVLRLATERRYIPVNPCDAIRLPRRSAYGDKGELREMLFLTAAEVAAVAEAIDPHYKTLIYTAAYSGLRAGELGGLRRRDVDTLHGRLRVQRALKEVNTRSKNIAPEDKGLIFGHTKTGKVRSVGIPAFLKNMLADHLAASPGGPDALVFTSPEGGPLRHGNFYRRAFKPTVECRYCGDCGKAVSHKAKNCSKCAGEKLAYVLSPEKHGLRFHDLRHTCAALLIAADAHPKAIQEHLGHKDIQTTFNVYGHLLPSAQEALAAALDAVYDGGQPSNVRQLATA